MAVKEDKSPTGPDFAVHSPAESQVGIVPTEADRTEDLALMQLVAAGDERAKRVIAHRLVHRVRRLSKMILLDETMADDAAQNSLIEILRSAKTYRGQSSVERWADRITARTALRHKRDERRHAPAHDSGVDAEDLQSSPAPSEIRDVLPRPMEDYLVALPDVQREALILKHSFDYTTEEIAEMTGTAVGTIKDRLVTARRHIRRLIQRDLSLNIGSRGRT